MIQRSACALVMLFGLTLGACAPRGASRSGTESATTVAADSAVSPTIVNLEIGGMVCEGCVARVQKQLEAVPGVHRVDISLADQRAVVLADPAVRDTALTGAVRRAGSEFVGLVLKP